MALTKAALTVQASATVTAGTALNTSSFDGSYGFSILAQITNGSSAPTAAPTAILQGSNDSGTTWFSLDTRNAGTAASTPYTFEFVRGVAGSGGDWGSYRLQFNTTGNNVTAQADGSKTTAI